MAFIVDVETSALEPLEEDARILCIGLKKAEDRDVTVLFDVDEKKILEQFWAMVNPYETVIGFNFDFDHRWLILRSLKHELPVKRLKIIDLRTILGLGNKFAKGKLEDFAELIGGSKEDFKSREIPILWKMNKIEEMKKYNKQDVALTEKLYLKMKKIGLVGELNESDQR